MQAPRFLHTLLTSSLPVVHAKRLQALLDTVGTLLGERRLGLTALGRALPGPVDTKHTIKRVDRLLGNPHLHQERPLFYWLVATLLVGHTTRPLILVDWSPIDDRGRQFLLRAAVPFAGRSLPIFEKVHHKDGCQHCEAYLLAALAEILPDSATPILVTDAGFRNPWFKAVEARGWYYVGRVRSPTRCQVPGGEWQPVTALFQQATSVPQSLGSVEIAESNPLTTHMVLYHRPPKGRKHRNKRGQVSHEGRSRAMAQRQKEPWVLVSNLPERSTLADKLVAIYRMALGTGVASASSARCRALALLGNPPKEPSRGGQGAGIMRRIAHNSWGFVRVRPRFSTVRDSCPQNSRRSHAGLHHRPFRYLGAGTQATLPCWLADSLPL